VTASTSGATTRPGGNAAAEVTRRFGAMDTDVPAIGAAVSSEEGAAPAAPGGVEARFHRAEACASHFRPESGLSALNRSAGRPFPAPAPLFEPVGAALDVAATTDGAFEPTLLERVEQAGYDRSVVQVGPSDRSPAGTPAPTHPPTPAPAARRRRRLGAPARKIATPAGGRLDHGGIGEGWTVERACALLRAPGRD
jgi:thiamine biosynthesis lipoprotein